MPLKGAPGVSTPYRAAYLTDRQTNSANRNTHSTARPWMMETAPGY